jgi:multiple sugar transport system ATP-binding protein
MAFGLKMRKYPKEEIGSRLAEAAGILDLESYLDRLPKQLSGGQRQRVAVGRAIVRKPAAFLFDEPLSNLDAKLRVEMRAELKKLHARLRTTTIYVTHDQVEAMTLGERIVVLKDGVIQQVGEPLALYDRPANRFVAGFLGTPPMNFLDGRLERTDGGFLFTDGHARLRLADAASGPLCGCEGRPVELGVRPEKLDVLDAPETAGDAIQAQVEVVEPLGNETLVHFRTPKQGLVAMIDAHRPVRAGATMWLSAPPDWLHVFDKESGNNLTLGA